MTFSAPLRYAVPQCAPATQHNSSQCESFFEPKGRPLRRIGQQQIDPRPMAVAHECDHYFAPYVESVTLRPEKVQPIELAGEAV